jgi:hypothetical protein
VHYRNHIYAIGGISNKIDKSKALERYDVYTEAWESWPELPVAYTSPSAAMYKKEIYVLSKFYAEIAVINPETMSVNVINSGIQ